MLARAILTLIIALAWLAMPSLAEAALYVVSAPLDQAAPDEQFEVVVGVDTEGERVNLFSVNVAVPEGLEIIEMSKEGSVVNLWIKEPAFDAQARTVSFVGGVPGGFVGRAALVKLKAQAAAEGAYAFTVDPDSQAYLNDGQGTLARVSTKSLDIQIERVREKGVVQQPSIRVIAAVVSAALLVLAGWFWRRRRRQSRGVSSASFLLIVAGLTAWFAPQSARAASPVRLFIEPAVQSLTVGQEFNVAVKVESKERAVNAAEAVLIYPEDLLQAVSLSTANSFVQIWVEKPEFQNGGRVRFSGGRPTPGLQGIGEVVLMRFKTLKSGDPIVSFSYGSVLANDGSGANVLDELQGGHYSVGPALTIPEALPREALRPQVRKVVASPALPATAAPALPPSPQGTPLTAPESAASPPPGGATSAPSAPGSASAVSTPPIMTRLKIEFDHSALSAVLDALPEGVKLPYVPVVIRIQGSVARDDFERIGFLEFRIDSSVAQKFRLSSRQWRYDLHELLSLGEHQILLAAIDIDGRRIASPQAARFAVTLPSCFDGKDNDGDNLFDHPDDPGCESRADTSEEETVAQALALVLPAAFEQRMRSTVIYVQTSKVYETLDVQVINNPTVEDINANVAAPATVGVSAINVSLAVRFRTLMGYLQGIVSQPLFLLGRRRRGNKGAARLAMPPTIEARTRRWHIHRTIAWSGPAFALVSVAITPTIPTVALLWVQFALLAIFKRLAEGRAFSVAIETPSSWSERVNVA